MGKQLDKIQELIERREKARLGGGEKAIAKQHSTVAPTSAWRRKPMTAMAL